MSILCLGCSFTDPYYRSDLKFLRWPELIGDHFKMPVINLGERAVGNEKIFHKLYDYVTFNDHIKKVFILWTGFDRQAFFDSDCRHRSSSVIMRMLQEFEEGIPPAFEYKWFDIEKVIHLNFRIFYLTQQLCKQNNIELISMQGVHPIHYKKIESLKNKGYSWPFSLFDITEQKVVNTFLNDPYFSMIDTQTFSGFPILKSLGGETLLQHINYKQHPEYYISENDNHPNQIGHQKIASTMLDTYYKKYSISNNNEVSIDFIYE